jgi:hypothetical protein
MRFIIPIIFAAVLVPLFCWWEARQDPRYATLPVAIMKEPKFLVLCFTGCVVEFSHIGGLRAKSAHAHNVDLKAPALRCGSA